MKTIKSYLILILFLGIGLQSNAVGIEFQETSWEELVQMATDQNKFIFVDAYATWCGPCKKMSKSVFTDESLGNWYNENFISMKLDMESQGMGTDFANKHNIKAYPTFMFFAPNGDFVHRAAGFKDVDQFLQVGINSMDPEKQLAGMTAKYDANKEDADFLYNYITVLNDAAMSTKKVVSDYLATQSDKDLTSEKTWNIITAHLYDANSPYFQKVMDKKDVLTKKYGAEKVNKYVSDVYAYRIYDIAKSKDEKQLSALKTEITKQLPTQQYELNAKADYIFYKDNKDKGHDFAVLYFDRYCTSSKELNGIAWDYYEKVDNPAQLQKALFWANKSIQLEENWFNTDTKANLLYKLNMIPEAKTAAEHSIKIAQKDGEDPKETRDLLNKIVTDMENNPSR